MRFWSTDSFGASAKGAPVSDAKQPPTWKYSDPKEGTKHYANHVRLFWSGVDVTLVFGEMTHSDENLSNNVIGIDTRAQMTISWPVAKLIATNLSDLIAKYEEKNGELKLPGGYQIP